MTRTPLFPEAYSPWLTTRLPGGVIETLATCGSCAMEKPYGLTRDPGPFNPKLKCCTYFPFVPNFGLGAMLESPSARVRIQAAAQTGLLLPQGLFASPERETLVKQSEFGTRRDLLCPFFDTNTEGCSVWQNRPGVCTTYFCMSNREAVGLEFWADVESYLNHFEWSIATEVLWRLGFTDDDLELSNHAMLTEEPGPEREYLIGRAWAEWADRREDLLLAASEKAREISQAELNELLGDEALELEESLRARTV